VTGRGLGVICLACQRAEDLHRGDVDVRETCPVLRLEPAPVSPRRSRQAAGGNVRSHELGCTIDGAVYDTLRRRACDGTQPRRVTHEPGTNESGSAGHHDLLRHGCNLPNVRAPRLRCASGSSPPSALKRPEPGYPSGQQAYRACAHARLCRKLLFSANVSGVSCCWQRVGGLRPEGIKLWI
jgi:hypothetical protein